MRSALAVASILCLALALTAGCDSGPAKNQVAYDVCTRQGSTPEPTCRCFAEKMLAEYSPEELRLVNKFLALKLASLDDDKSSFSPASPDDRTGRLIIKVATECHMEQ